MPRAPGPSAAVHTRNRPNLLYLTTIIIILHIGKIAFHRDLASGAQNAVAAYIFI